ncbi:ABC-type transport auxiliary lipoprotein family protein [Ideonella sp.]|uniref:ABC-type transport auxiliary lipoprotein family protein n=1 Tax=Ideonella sp. TaxID=1929293 RepID=UPI002B49D489|nr:ABC-type transport auxiliary lipoprotein family protein [Ideonella sp.]HJV71621.1 ABC-type transport auxiliary lipoprotein family protein [Ideonella sp.]
MKHLVPLLVAVALSACSSMGSHEPDRYFILESTTLAAAGPDPAAKVVVARTSSASFYDTQDIVYSREPGTRAYYRYGHWTERPQRALHAQLLSRLGTAAAGQPVLNSRLEEIYHDASQPPGAARITLAVELIDPASRAIIARQRFTRTAPAASYDAAGAVSGMRQALDGLLDDVAAWVDAHAAPPAR